LSATRQISILWIKIITTVIMGYYRLVRANIDPVVIIFRNQEVVEDS